MNSPSNNKYKTLDLEDNLKKKYRYLNMIVQNLNDDLRKFENECKRINKNKHETIHHPKMEKSFVNLKDFANTTEENRV